MNRKDYKEIIGERFGFVVVSKINIPIKGRTTAEILCDCGNTKTVIACSVAKNLCKSCGCSLRGATRKEQHRIVRENNNIIFLGQAKRICEWAKFYKVSESCIRYRLSKNIRLDEPPPIGRKKIHRYNYDKQTEYIENNVKTTVMRSGTIICYTNGKPTLSKRFKGQYERNLILKRWSETYLSWQYQIIPDEGEASEILTY